MERHFEIAVRAPFRLDLTVWALRRRAHNQIDRFDAGCWRRVLVVAGRTVQIGVTQVAGPDRARLAVEVTSEGSPRGGIEEEVRRIVRRGLGLELFFERPQRERDRLLPPGLPRVAVEAASPFGWCALAPTVIGMTSFGASGKADDLYRLFGITAEAVADAARKALE